MVMKHLPSQSVAHGFKGEGAKNDLVKLLNTHFNVVSNTSKRFKPSDSLTALPANDHNIAHCLEEVNSIQCTENTHK